jgi:hypothetical protein
MFDDKIAEYGCRNGSSKGFKVIIVVVVRVVFVQTGH